MYQDLLIKYASLGIDKSSLLNIINGAIKSDIDRYSSFRDYIHKQLNNTSISVEDIFDMVSEEDDAKYSSFKYKILAAKDEPLVVPDSGSPSIPVNVVRSSQ